MINCYFLYGNELCFALKKEKKGKNENEIHHYLCRLIKNYAYIDYLYVPDDRYNVICVTVVTS